MIHMVKYVSCLQRKNQFLGYLMCMLIVCNYSMGIIMLKS